MSTKRKNLDDGKVKYSPVKKSSNKHNIVFIREYKFGLLVLELKKSTDPKEDAYIKDFIDVLESDDRVSENLKILKVIHPRGSSKVSVPKTQPSGYKQRVLIGLASPKDENDPNFRRAWADKIIQYLNTEIKWKYFNSFKFRGDLTNSVNGKICNGLDEVLLDEDIGGFVGMCLFDSIDEIKGNNEIMEGIFSHPENLEVGESVLKANWGNWTEDEE